MGPLGVSGKVDAHFPFPAFEPAATSLLISLSYLRVQNPALRSQAFLLRGPRGAGKSSLIRAIASKIELCLLEYALDDDLEWNTEDIDSPRDHLILLRDDGMDLSTEKADSISKLLRRTLVLRGLSFVMITRSADLPKQLEAMFDLAVSLQPQLNTNGIPSVLRYLLGSAPPLDPETEAILHEKIAALNWPQIRRIRGDLADPDRKSPASHEERTLHDTCAEKDAISKLRRILSDRPVSLFDSHRVVGLKDQRAIIQHHVASLKENSQDAALPRKRAILMHGPPGSGKTMLAESILRRSTLNCIYVQFVDWVHPEVSMPEIRIRSTFRSAKRNQPSIIFVDEFDAFFGSHLSSSHRGCIATSITNQLKEELGGLNPNTDRVMLLAATNYPERIPSSLLGPNKIEFLVGLSLPHAHDLLSILEPLVSSGDIEPSTDIQELADLMVGLSVREVKEVIEQAVVLPPSGDRPSPLGGERIKSALEKKLNKKILLEQFTS